MLLKKEVRRNLEKGREWAAGGREGGTVVCFLSPRPPPPTTSPSWTKLSPSCFCFSASYNRTKTPQHLFRAGAPALTLTQCGNLTKSRSLSTPSFPCEQWRCITRWTLNSITFYKPTGLSLFSLWDNQKTNTLLAMRLWTSYLIPLMDHQNESMYSFFLSPMK